MKASEPRKGDATGAAIGPVRVAAAAADISHFAAALGLEQGNSGEALRVPVTFPLRWMFEPAVQEAVVALISPAIGLIHEAQTIEYRDTIEAGASYDLVVDVERSGAEGTALVTGRIFDLSGRLVCTLASRARPVGAKSEPAV